MTFQASDNKERHFLNLLDDEFNPIELSYSKRESWIKFFSYSNSLCIKAMRAITNHTPIEEYYLRFFLQEEFLCPCGQYSIKTRWYTFYDCRQFNNY